MTRPGLFACTICGEQNHGDGGWFLIVENSWLDSLGILGWNESFALTPGVHCLCSAAHVRELVAHWMVTGSLKYPFADLSAAPQKVTIREFRPRKEGVPAIDNEGVRYVGELAVHRESLARTLQENPQALGAILEALRDALNQELTGKHGVIEAAEELALV